VVFVAFCGSMDIVMVFIHGIYGTYFWGKFIVNISHLS